MRAISLQSGSKGNCIYVETSGARFLVDAGLSVRETVRRLALVGRRLSDIDALLLTHEHTDHSLSVGGISSRYGIPVYLTAATEEALASPPCAGFPPATDWISGPSGSRRCPLPTIRSKAAFS